MSASIQVGLHCEINISSYVHDVKTETEAKAVLANTLRDIATRIETMNAQSLSRALVDDLTDEKFGFVAVVTTVDGIIP